MNDFQKYVVNHTFSFLTSSESYKVEQKKLYGKSFDESYQWAITTESIA